MGTYAVTGSASGIGAAVAATLKSEGHRVITVDVRDADIVADLGSQDGRQKAIDGILDGAAEGLDGFVPCAGVGPQTDPVTLVARINFFGSVALVEALKDRLAKKRGAVVLISSNSATMGDYDAGYLEALAKGDEDAACDIVALLPGQTAYGGSKFALGCWMRRNNADYARVGIRMNAIAPGYTETAMTAEGLKDPVYGPAIKAFVESIPIGRPGKAQDQADVVAFLLSERASFVSGAVIFVDGGHDAIFRSNRF